MVPPGGNSKRFEASTSDFIVTWYPGKQNTLTFKGRSGCLAKEYLINLCAVSAPKNIENVVENRVSRHGFDENVGDIMLEIEILKSRFDSLQFLLDSRENPDLHTTSISKLGSEISLLQIDLEEEKNRNKVLEFEVKCLQQEIKTLKQLFNASESRDHLNCKVALTDLITEVEFPDRPLLNQVNEFESPERPKVQSSESLYSIQVIESESSERSKKQLSPDQSTDQQILSLLANSANLNEDRSGHRRDLFSNQLAKYKEKHLLKCSQYKATWSEPKKLAKLYPTIQTKYQQRTVQSNNRSEDLEDSIGEESVIFVDVRDKDPDSTGKLNCHSAKQSTNKCLASQVYKRKQMTRRRAISSMTTSCRNQHKPSVVILSLPIRSAHKNTKITDGNLFFRKRALLDRNKSWRTHLHLVSKLTSARLPFLKMETLV